MIWKIRLMVTSKEKLPRYYSYELDGCNIVPAVGTWLGINEVQLCIDNISLSVKTYNGEVVSTVVDISGTHRVKRQEEMDRFLKAKGWKEQFLIDPQGLPKDLTAWKG